MHSLNINKCCLFKSINDIIFLRVSVSSMDEHGIEGHLSIEKERVWDLKSTGQVTTNNRSTAGIGFLCFHPTDPTLCVVRQWRWRQRSAGKPVGHSSGNRVGAVLLQCPFRRKDVHRATAERRGCCSVYERRQSDCIDLSSNAVWMSALRNAVQYMTCAELVGHDTEAW